MTAARLLTWQDSAADLGSYGTGGGGAGSGSMHGARNTDDDWSMPAKSDSRAASGYEEDQVETESSVAMGSGAQRGSGLRSVGQRRSAANLTASWDSKEKDSKDDGWGKW